MATIKRTPNELRVGDRINHRGTYRTITEITKTGRGFIRARLDGYKPGRKGPGTSPPMLINGLVDCALN